MITNLQNGTFDLTIAENVNNLQKLVTLMGKKRVINHMIDDVKINLVDIIQATILTQGKNFNSDALYWSVIVGQSKVEDGRQLDNFLSSVNNFLKYCK